MMKLQAELLAVYSQTEEKLCVCKAEAIIFELVNDVNVFVSFCLNQSNRLLQGCEVSWSG